MIGSFSSEQQSKADTAFFASGYIWRQFGNNEMMVIGYVNRLLQLHQTNLIVKQFIMYTRRMTPQWSVKFYELNSPLDLQVPGKIPVYCLQLLLIVHPPQRLRNICTGIKKAILQVLLPVKNA